MKLFRIAKARHIEDLTGEGARLNANRWNEKGTAVIYTSQSLSLAALEYLVHLPIVLAPALMYRIFEVPDEVKFSRVRTSSLPRGWNAMPFQDETSRMGSAWVKGGKTLMLRVPSVIVPGEFNFILNPGHLAFGKVKPGRPRPFIFDERILGRIRNSQEKKNAGRH